MKRQLRIIYRMVKILVIIALVWGIFFVVFKYIPYSLIIFLLVILLACIYQIAKLIEDDKHKKKLIDDD